MSTRSKRSAKQAQSAAQPGSVDCSLAKKNLWLVKVPKYLSEQWQKHEGETVGSLKVGDNGVSFVSSLTQQCTNGSATSMQSKMKQIDIVPVGRRGPGVGPSSSLSSPSSSSNDNWVPPEHEFVLSKLTGQTLAVMAEDKTQIYTNLETRSGKLTVEGRIAQRAECRPIRTKNYMQMKSKQIQRYNNPKTKIQQIERAEQKFKPVDSHKEQRDAEKFKKSGTKSVRRDKHDVLDQLFSLFEKHQYYKLVDLHRLTEQPPSYLKEILSEIAHYNTAPPHRAMWELKPEYRAYQQSGTKTEPDSAEEVKTEQS